MVRVGRTNSRYPGGAVQFLHLRRTRRVPLRRLPKGRGVECLTFISVNCATPGRSQSIAKPAKNLSVRIVGIVPRTAKTRGKKVPDLLTEIEDLARLILSYDMTAKPEGENAPDEKAI